MRADAFLDDAPTADAFLDEVGPETGATKRRPMRGRERSIYVAPDNPANPILPTGGSVLEGIKMPAPTFDEERRGRAVVDQAIAANAPAPRAPRPTRDAKGIAKDIYSILGNTGVQLVKPFVDIPNMVVGGALDPARRFLDATSQAANDAASPTTRYDRETLAQMPEGATVDKIGHIISNPGLALNMGLPSAASLVLPLAAVKGAGALLPRTAASMGDEFATKVAVGANALMNAGDTFGQTDGDLPGRLLAAALAGGGTALVGKATGGGLEGQLARGKAPAGWIPAAKAVGMESLQEAGEGASQSLAQNVGEVQPLNLSKAMDDAAIGAVLAPIVAGPINVAQVATDPRRARAKALADLLGAFDPADAPAPASMDAAVTAPAPVRFDPAAAAQAIQPAPKPAPQLGYDPTVQNPQTPIVVDPQGNARPMSADEFLSAEASQQEAQATGLTPDVRQAIEQRNASPEPEPVNVPSDLLERLQAAGWKPPLTPAPAAAPQAAVPASEGNNPNPDPQDVAAIGADLERLYQEDIKSGIKRRLGLEKPEPGPAEPKPKTSAFRSFLRETGIAPELAADVTGERGFRANSLLPRTFRKGGLQLDEIVQRAVERGFLTDNQVESALDNGGTNRLIEMIQAEMRGDRQVSTEMAGDQIEQAFQRRATDDLDAQARAIGLDTDGMDDGQIAAALGRIERRRARAAERGQLFDAPRETRAERQAVQDDADLAALDDADIPWNTTESNVSTEQAMRALGFDDQEIADAIAEESRGAPQSGSSDRSPGQDGASGTQRAPAADQGSAPGPTEGQARADEGLTSYTPEELRQRDQRIADKAREEARQQAETDAKAKADAQRGDFTLTGSDRPADANAGQSSIFDQPAPAQPKAEPPKQPTPPAPKPADLVDLRKRLSVLRALKECLV